MARPPPANLASCRPILRPVDGLWYRIAEKRYRGTVHYFSSSITNRFSSPNAKYGVCYYGESPSTAFGETIASHKLRDDMYFFEHELADLELHEIRISDCKEMAIDLTGQGLNAVRAKAECFNTSGPEGYSVSQEWARQLMEHPVEHCGLTYLGNNSAALCFGLYGEHDSSGEGGRKCKGSTLEVCRTRSLLESAAFNQWITDCGYQICAA